MNEPSSPKLPATESTPRPRQPGGGVARITVTQGVATGASLTLTRARATVGRHQTNDLVLADPRVSAAHLELERRELGRVVARDMGTTNGTWLGSNRIVEIELAPGALLRIGDSALRFELDDRASPEVGSAGARFGALIGVSDEMKELFATLEKLAATEIAVLVQGDTGTGKETLARALHGRSARSEKPLIVVDTSAIPSPLLESALFGHEQGAFVGADARHIGLLEQATGGTVFIGEVFALPIDLQPKLLRAIESKVLHRVGGKDAVPLDVRIIAATHRDLRAEIDAGRFREDLYLGLAQARVVLPPLRARSVDIPHLARAFAAELATAERPLTFDEGALATLAKSPWPGNVRELKNVTARAAALCSNGTITENDLAGEGFGFRGTAAEREVLDLAGTFADAKGRAIERFEKAYLDALMRRCVGNLSRASREADIARNHLRALLKKRGLYDPGDT